MMRLGVNLLKLSGLSAAVKGAEWVSTPANGLNLQLERRMFEGERV